MILLFMSFYLILGLAVLYIPFKKSFIFFVGFATAKSGNAIAAAKSVRYDCLSNFSFQQNTEVFRLGHPTLIF